MNQGGNFWRKMKCKVTQNFYKLNFWQILLEIPLFSRLTDGETFRRVTQCLTNRAIFRMKLHFFPFLMWHVSCQRLGLSSSVQWKVWMINWSLGVLFLPQISGCKLDSKALFLFLCSPCNGIICKSLDTEKLRVLKLCQNSEPGKEISRVTN